MTEGGRLSYVRVKSSLAPFGFPARSVVTPESMRTLRMPCPSGITSNEYVAPCPNTFDATPSLTMISAAVNPVTSSLNVAVTGIGDMPVGSGAPENRLTAGGVASKVRVSGALAVFVAHSSSMATPSGISTTTDPSPSGITPNVYAAPAPAKPVTLPFSTIRSSARNPSIGSAKVAVMRIGDWFVGSDAGLLRAAQGRSLS